MLQYLLDEHFSRRVAEQIRAKRADITVLTLHEWEDGSFLGVDEANWIDIAFRHSLTLVTYDRSTVEPLLQALGNRGVTYGGVVLIDQRTIRQSDVGGLVRALIALWDSAGDKNWTDRVAFLRPAQAHGS